MRSDRPRLHLQRTRSSYSKVAFGATVNFSGYERVSMDSQEIGNYQDERVDGAIK